MSFFYNQRSSSFRLIACVMNACFIFSCFSPLPASAQSPADLGLPTPGSMVSVTSAYVPVMVKGLKVHPENPVLFDFIVDTGNSGLSVETQNLASLQKESEKLIKYFLASLTIPKQDLWVNLSPYEKDRIVPEQLGQTEMGRDMLAQDYVLKQLTASLIYPEKELGKEFWNKVYSKAQAMYGSTEIPVNTFNKVWIVADKAKVYVHNNTAFVVGSHLKVMLEEDYLASQKHKKVSDTFLSSQIIREIVLPELEKEVNQGKTFANLRQIFHSMILATWYKKSLRDSLLNQVYSNKAKINGVETQDKTIKEQIYQEYLKAYKKGVFNYIKDDINNGQKTPRKYFSGGVLGQFSLVITNNRQDSDVRRFAADGAMVSITAGIQKTRDSAMSAGMSIAMDSLPDQLKNDSASVNPKKISKEAADFIQKIKTAPDYVEEINQMSSKGLSIYTLKEVLNADDGDRGYRHRLAVLMYMRLRKDYIKLRVGKKALLKILIPHAFSPRTSKYPGVEDNEGVRISTLTTIANFSLDDALTYIVDSLDPKIEDSVRVREGAALILLENIDFIKLSHRKEYLISELQKEKLKNQTFVDLTALLFLLTEDASIDTLPINQLSSAAEDFARRFRSVDAIAIRDRKDWYHEQYSADVIFQVLKTTNRLNYKARMAALRIMRAHKKEFLKLPPDELRAVLEGCAYIDKRKYSGKEYSFEVRKEALKAMMDLDIETALPYLFDSLNINIEPNSAVQSLVLSRISENIPSIIRFNKKDELIGILTKLAHDPFLNKAKITKVIGQLESMRRSEDDQQQIFNSRFIEFKSFIDDKNVLGHSFDPQHLQRLYADVGPEYFITFEDIIERIIKSNDPALVDYRLFIIALIPFLNSLHLKYIDIFRERLVSSLGSKFQEPVELVRYRIFLSLISIGRQLPPSMRGEIINILRNPLEPGVPNENRLHYLQAWSQDNDSAMIASESPGGIDLNSKNMQFDVDGQKIDMRWDPAQMADFKRGDFSGVRPVILKLAPIRDVTLLLG